MRTYLKVCIDTDGGDSLGLIHAMKLVGLQTPLEVKVVSDVSEANLLIFAHVHHSRQDDLFDAQRHEIPILIIGDERLHMLAEQMCATFVPIQECDWQRLYEAMEVALDPFPQVSVAA